MLLVNLALKTLLSISQNGINQITLNKQLGNHLNMDIINALNYQKCFYFFCMSVAFLLFILKLMLE